MDARDTPDMASPMGSTDDFWALYPLTPESMEETVPSYRLYGSSFLAGEELGMSTFV